MRRILRAPDLSQFIEEGQQILDECKILKRDTDKLVRAHAYVVGKLCKFGGLTDDEEANMRRSVNRFESDAARKAKRAQKSVWAIVPFWKNKLIRRGEELQGEANNLRVAVHSFQALNTVHRQLTAVIRGLADTLNGLLNNLANILSDGKGTLAFSRSHTIASRHYAALRDSAIEVIKGSDKFL
jgi:hypothetical protein